MISLLFALLACGDREKRSPVPDAGQDAGGDAGVFEPTPPAPPAAPVLGPCPAGWRAATDPDLPEIVTCRPWNGAEPQDCPPDQVHWPDGEGCERVGPVCPDGEWAKDLPAGAIHVRAGEPAGGDGTRAAPFGMVADALGAANDGDVVALSTGRFDEAVVVRGAITLRGACVGGTVVASTTPSEIEGTILLARGATVQDLTVAGDRLGVRANPSTERATIRSVVVDAADGVGIVVGGTAALLEDVVVRGTRGGPLGSFGYGLDVEAGADVELDHVSLEQNRGVALVVGASTVRGTDLVLKGTLGRSTDLRAGYGMQVLENSTIDVERLVAHRNKAIAVVIVGPNTTMRAADVWVADTLAQESDGLNGLGLNVFGGSLVELERATFSSNRTFGISAAESATVVTATDLVVQDGLEQESDGLGGYGVQAFLGGRVEITRGALVRNRVAAVFVDGAQTSFEAVDLRVSGTIAPPGGLEPGLGVEVRTGAAALMQRALIDDNAGIGVVAYDAGATLVLEDVAVERTSSLGGDEGGGSGVIALLGGSVDATRFRFSDNAFCGLQLASGGVVDLQDGIVSGNLVGANVQTEGFDLARLQDRIVYRDNARDLDTTALPLPVP